jgi:hypothetical protein
MQRTTPDSTDRMRGATGPRPEESWEPKWHFCAILDLGRMIVTPLPDAAKRNLLSDSQPR